VLAELKDGPLARQARWVESYALRLDIRERGSVVSVGDGIAWMHGLPSAAVDDVLAFQDGSLAMVFDLTPELVGTVLLRETPAIKSGTTAQVSRKALAIPVGDALLGRVVDPMGAPLDGGPPPDCKESRALQRRAPAIVERDFVNEPLYTGSKIIDTLVPIGRGQRQLIVGDRGLGRSAIAIDAVVNQKGKNVYCVYVLVGQRRSIVVSTIDTLREYGALEHTTVVVAEASALPGLQYLAPFAGCSIAEHWMGLGHDTLVVYDDLSTHAKTYRELSLLLRRPPGREAYSGDIFSVHARLLERSTRLNAAYGGGTMTALPIVETEQGEIAAYIPTNLISITDGQIYLDTELFAGGFRPAIDVSRSVSRIGGAAQEPHIKQEAGRTKLDYLQFLELEVFTRFGARLEASMERAIRRGRVLRECLKQDRLTPLPVQFQMAWLVAFNDGLLDALEPEAVASRLDDLALGMRGTDLDFGSPRAQWSAAVARALRQGQGSA
jgi:F-type H+/Na+-transporting ATPase subunit alpha